MGGRLGLGFCIFTSLLILGCASDPVGQLPEPGPRPAVWFDTASPDRSWNVVLITLDTTRRDRLGCYGSKQNLTPHIDSLAARGVVFAEAISPTPITLPSHATILTALDPPAHGVRNNGTFVLDSTHVTLAEVLRERGYATGAVLAGFPVDSRFGLAQGFDFYDDDFPAESRQRTWQTAQRPADQVTRRSLEWIAAQPQPFFLWAHYFDPHFPYEPPADFRKPDRALYDGEVAFMDAQVGELVAGLRARGRLASTWFLLVADHGESLGEHGEETHSMLIYGATQHVPCILVPPEEWRGLEAKKIRGRTIAAVVRLCDLAPTLLNGAGLEREASIGTGSSLLPLIAGDWEGPRVAYMETLVPFLEYGWSELRGVRTATASYIRAPEEELYDLRQDVREEENLFVRQEKAAGPLVAWCDYLAPDEEAPATQSIDAETAERLRSLGYVASSAPRTVARNPRDPKRLMGLFDRINAARTDLGVNRPKEAAQTLVAVLADDPSNPEALRLLASARLRLGDGAGALAAYDSLSRAFPNDPDLRLNRGRALILAGDLAGAERELEPLLRDNPEDGAASELLALALTGQGRQAEAIARLQAAIAARPRDPEARVVLARIYWSAGRMSSAEQLAGEALAIDPEHAAALAILGECQWMRAESLPNNTRDSAGRALRLTAHENLSAALKLDPLEPIAAFRMGWIERQAGRAEAALEYYERALVRRPESPETHVNLANLLREAGRVEEALHHYEIAQVLGYEQIDYLVNHGVCLAMAGRPREALAMWERAYERAPDPRYADGIRKNIEQLRARMGMSDPSGNVKNTVR